MLGSMQEDSLLTTNCSVAFGVDRNLCRALVTGKDKGLGPFSLLSTCKYIMQVEQDDEKVKEAADVAHKAFEGGTGQNGVAAPREAPPPSAKKPSETNDGHLTEKETRATGTP